MKESIRDVITGDLTLEYFAKRFGEGWKLASIEWAREADHVSTSVQPSAMLPGALALPYGIKILEDGRLQENPLEMSVLLLILEQIIKEKRIQEIAQELNLRGYSTRGGTAWTATDVFNLMPRLIEAGPMLLKSAAWLQRRPASTSTQPGRSV